MRMLMMLLLLLLEPSPAQALVVVVVGVVGGHTSTPRPTSFRSQPLGLQSRPRSKVAACYSQVTSNDSDTDDEDETVLQWQLFQEHHALGSWKGLWTTYDSMGDVVDEVVAAVHLQSSNRTSSGASSDDNPVVQHTHEIAIGATRSDCATCFDSLETRTIPISTYQPHNLLQKNLRLAACGMVVGPRILRSSGAAATELAIRFGDGRVRAILQHAPVWKRRSEEERNEDVSELEEQRSFGPPDGLKVARVLLSREALRDNPPTPESEAAAAAKSAETSNNNNGDGDNDNDNDSSPTTTISPTFYRPVPPFAWNRNWGGGTSWTWGPGAGNQGWRIDSLPEGDDWHGSAAPGLWNLRVPGSPITLQSTAVVTPGEVALVRLAWMPDNNHLLRLEAGFVALEPMNDDNNNNDNDDHLVVALAPPRLVSLRCDVLQNMGELEG